MAGCQCGCGCGCVRCGAPLTNCEQSQSHGRTEAQGPCVCVTQAFWHTLLAGRGHYAVRGARGRPARGRECLWGAARVVVVVVVVVVARRPGCCATHIGRILCTKTVSPLPRRESRLLAVVVGTLVRGQIDWWSCRARRERTHASCTPPIAPRRRAGQSPHPRARVVAAACHAGLCRGCVS